MYILMLAYLIGALAISFLCSILEAALLSAPVSFISMKEAEGDKRAKRLHDYKNNIDRPVAAILSLNTIAHTIGAAGVGAEATHIFGEAYFGLVSAVLTLLILVFSEIIPKTIGASHWRRLVLPCTSIIRALIIICYPLVLLSELITKVFSTSSPQVSVSREEVSAMLNVGTEEGIFKPRENSTIQNFLTTAKVTAREVMTPSLVVASAPEEMTMSEFHGHKKFNPYSRILVYADSPELVTGYILRASVLEKLAEDKFDLTLSAIRRPIMSFSEDALVAEIWDKMIERKEHISIITDEYGCLRGIVTMEDVIETMLGVEIVDENDTTTDMQKYAREKWQKIKAKNSL